MHETVKNTRAFNTLSEKDRAANSAVGSLIVEIGCQNANTCRRMTYARQLTKDVLMTRWRQNTSAKCQRIDAILITGVIQFLTRRAREWDPTKVGFNVKREIDKEKK